MTGSVTKQSLLLAAMENALDRGVSADDLCRASGIESRSVLQTSLSYVAKRPGVSVVSVTVRDWRAGRTSTRYYLRQHAPHWALYAVSRVRA